MQLNAVVLPAPLGPMSPTISYSSTCRLTSRSACRPPKRIESSTASRTGIDALRSRSAGQVDVEALPLQPPADRRRERPDALGLEDQGDDGQEPGEGGDDVDGVVLDEADRLPDVGEVLASQHVEEGEHHDPPSSSQAADDGDDQVGQGGGGDG